MTMHASGDLAALGGIGGLLSGVGEVLVAIGGIATVVIRGRNNAKKERIRAEEAAALAAQQTKKTMEDRIEKQHDEQIIQLNNQIKDLQEMVRQLLTKALEDRDD